MNLLTLGIYTVSDAAKLLRVDKQKIRGWISGYPRARVDPLVENEIGWVDDELSFSFVNLMEMRFIQHFAQYGVRTNSIRRMAQEAKIILHHRHPFATKTIFRTDGRKIFTDIATSENDQHLYDLAAKNWAMGEVIEQSLYAGAIYDPSGDIAGWKPRPSAYSEIIIRPNISFGRPIVERFNIPTRTLHDAFRAEDGSYESVSKWYQVPSDVVRKAVQFETELALGR